ncbi:MAG: SGNH/GDSL hydrolase family protein [Chloroflexi bacterium]|nr:SGNH/GDSL hydrolase family protein [Chloroflexota bacterium]MCL5275313.1 SGNH/GDSL hydrolase family protein [Chloroflexota bacterium]
MKRPRLLQSVLIIPLLAAALMAAAPVAAKSTVALPFICAAPSDPNTVQLMIDVDSAYAYKAASWTSPAVGRVVKFDCFNAVGRNKNGEWLLIPYGNDQAWIHGSTVRFKGDIPSLPVTENVVAKTTLFATLPQGLPTITWRQRYIYRTSAWAGKDLNMFTVIGDCNSESPVYLGRFAAGGFDTSSYPSLASTVKWYTESFTRTSVATHGSFNAASAFDSTWSDPNQCNSDEGPLACELRISNASILIVALGTGDQHDWTTFESNYRAIIEYALKQGVLPVLMTKADALESQEGGAPPDYINSVIRKLGVAYRVPVVDFYLATRNLPNNGLLDEHNNALQTTNPFHLNEQGMDMRIFMTLQTLKAISGY